MATIMRDLDVDLVRRLVATQFPQWADLPVRPVEHDGWDNRTFRLGEEMSVRLPSASPYRHQPAKEQRWLPVLAPLLPLPIPTPLASGVPGHGYPYVWSVNRWLPGTPASVAGIADPVAFARDTAAFLRALYAIDPDGGPSPGPHNFFRGGPLTTYDDETRRAVAQLATRIDQAACLEVWEQALASVWAGPPVWVHGDVAVGNLLVRDGRLGAVIDFGGLAVGDPSCDCVLAWRTLSGEARRTFKEGMSLDQATWTRGRGWALWKALITFDAADPIEAETSRRTVHEVLDDAG